VSLCPAGDDRRTLVTSLRIRAARWLTPLAVLLCLAVMSLPNLDTDAHAETPTPAATASAPTQQPSQSTASPTPEPATPSTTNTPTQESDSPQAAASSQDTSSDGSDESDASDKPEPQYEAEVTFTTVQPTDKGLTLTGTILNTGTDPLYKVEVVLWRIRVAATTRDQLASTMDIDPESDAGDRMGTEGAVETIVDADRTFDPGQTASFSVTATWDDLGLTDDGAYMVGVHIRACDNPWGPRVTIGRGRTLVTRSTHETSQAATVVMLTSVPSLLHDSTFTDDHLADELLHRLNRLLGLAAQPGITWVIDPALHHEITVMASGYEVLTDTGSAPGTGQAAATAWLTSFAGLDPTAGYRLPWGNPDLALGATTRDATPVSSAIAAAVYADDTYRDDDTATPGGVSLSALPLLIRAGNGMVDETYLHYVATLKPAIMLAQCTTNAQIAGGQLLNTVVTPYADGPGPTDGDSDLQKLQRAWADDFVAEQPVIRVIETQLDATLASLPQPPWIHRVSLRTIAAPAAWTPSMSQGAAAGPLAPEVLATLPLIRDTAHAYASMVADVDATSRLISLPVASALSQSWPTTDAALSYVEQTRAWLDSLFDPVTITATPEVSLTSRTSSFPITVTNNLAVPINVRITASTEVALSPANVSIPTTEVQTIQPGDKLSLSLTPTIRREGDVNATLRLTTPDGVPIGAPVTVRIHATMSAWMGWVVVGSAFVLFIVGTFLRIRTAKAKRKAAEGGSGDAPADRGHGESR
jgi:hypothetical protein